MTCSHDRCARLLLRLLGVPVAVAAASWLLLAGCGDAGGSPGTASAQAGDPSAGASSPAQADTPQVPPEDEIVDITGLGHDEGDAEEAVVRVVEFSDFGCIHCANFHMQTYPPLYEEFVAAGEVAWKYVPVTIGGFTNGEVAAVAAECAAEQDAFRPMRARLYETRERWMASDDAESLLTGEAEELGLDRAAFERCLTEGERARERVMAGNQVAYQVGVRVTPTFIVHGHPVSGAPPLEPFQEALRQLVSEARDRER